MDKSNQSSSTDVFSHVSNAVVSGIFSGVMPWQVGGIPPLLTKDEKMISGINYLLLSQASYADPRWCLASEVTKRGWSVESGQDEKIAIFTLPAPGTSDGSRKITGAKLFNYSQLKGPDPFVMPAASPSDIASNLIAVVVNSGADVVAGDAVGYKDGVFTLSVPSADVNKWNAELTEAIAAHSVQHVAKLAGLPDSQDHSFTVKIAHTMLCAEYGVSMDSVRQDVTKEDAWVNQIGKDAKFAFRASNLAGTACEYVNELAPAPAAAESVINGSQNAEMNNRLFGNDAGNDSYESQKATSLGDIRESLSKFGLDDFSSELVAQLSPRRSTKPH